MKVDVYDTYATAGNGNMIHFDVLLPTDTPPESALKFARQWLASVGLSDATVEQSRCNFCHSENAQPQVIKDIELSGYHIIKMEGCP